MHKEDKKEEVRVIWEAIFLITKKLTVVQFHLFIAYNEASLMMTMSGLR